MKHTKAFEDSMLHSLQSMSLRGGYDRTKPCSLLRRKYVTLSTIYGMGLGWWMGCEKWKVLLCDSNCVHVNCLVCPQDDFVAYNNIVSVEVRGRKVVALNEQI